MPRSASAAVSAGRLKCGTQRETGCERTSITVAIEARDTSYKKRASEWFEWPIVKMDKFSHPDSAMLIDPDRECNEQPLPHVRPGDLPIRSAAADRILR